MKNITISIIIPCFNHGEFIQEAINSTDLHENDHCEVIVVNDGSTEKSTLLKLEELEKEGIQVIHQSNNGPASARNTGIKVAKGEFLLFLDADNLISPDYFKKALDVFNQNPSVSIVYSDATHFGNIKRTLVKTPEFSAERLLASNFIDTCAFVRKSVFEAIGGFDEKMPVYGNEDWELWIRCWSNDLTFYHIPEPLYYYRVSENSTLTIANQSKNRKALKYKLCIFNICIFNCT